MEYKDYYQTLGVSRDADEKEIKRAFRKLARQYHPDVNPGDPQAEERFKDVNEAHEVLSDPEKRRKYDQLGSAWKDWERTGGRPGDFDWNRWASAQPSGERVHVRYGAAEDLQDLFGGGSPFSDFFGQIFGSMGGAPGGAQHRPRPRKGQDLEQPVEITLHEAYEGSHRLLQKDNRQLRVKIPAGARDGARIRMAGEGGPGASGGEAGDLYLRVHVLADPRFERRGDDLHATAPIDLYTAVLGGTLAVQTMIGTVTLTIPPGTQNGQTFRLRGKGMPRLNRPDEHGDLYVQVEVRLPTTLSPEEREHFEALRDLSQEGA